MWWLGLLLLLIGVPIAVFGMIFMSLGGGGGFIFSLLPLIFGIFLTIRASKIIRYNALRGQYIDLIVNRGITSIDAIVRDIGVDNKEWFMADLQKVLDDHTFLEKECLNCLKGAHLNETKGTIVLMTEDKTKKVRKGVSRKEEEFIGLISNLDLGITSTNELRKGVSRKEGEYLDLIENHGITSISDIASKTQTYSGDVMEDLRKMINKGFFPGSSLDETKRVFVYSVTEKAKKEKLRYKKYFDLIEIQGIISISDIATLTKTLSEDVMADLQKMLDKGFFPGAFLDETKQVIVLEQDKKYLDLIKNQGVTLINDIAITTGESYEDVVTDLQRMIKADLFPGASLDTAKGAIVWVPQSVASAPGVVQVVQVQQAPQTPREKVIACPSCGANNKIMSGKVTECQYCGALIQ